MRGGGGGSGSTARESGSGLGGGRRGGEGVSSGSESWISSGNVGFFCMILGLGV